ncbi:MAG: Lrp/AsnC family transcriptional regulator [Lentisphaerae bacterium]|nr:Lrp/AsnC family transcriptional regulator [Lentisphaerota bacterium]
MKDRLLNILERNAALSIEELAIRLGCDADSVRLAINELVADRKIIGYKAILPENSTSKQVQALIEVKIAPRREGGFDTPAKRIALFPEVTDLALVSGSCDLFVSVRGDSLQEVAAFIAEKLATIDGVIATSTTFQLKQYKVSGRLLDDQESTERLAVCP